MIGKLSGGEQNNLYLYASFLSLTAINKIANDLEITMKQLTVQFSRFLVAFFMLWCAACQPTSQTIALYTPTLVKPTPQPVTPTPKMLPSSTPTKELLPTTYFMPTATKQPTETPSPTPTTIPDLSTGVFIFNNATGFYYAWRDSQTLEDSYIHPNFYFDTSPLGFEDENGPNDKISNVMSFAHYSNQVIFWRRGPEKVGQIWLTDLELQNPRVIFTDTEQLFNSDIYFPPRDVEFEWFPNDRYVLVQPANANAPRLLIDVATETYQLNWNWTCNTIIVSPQTRQFALLCTFEGQNLIMEWNGDFWLDTQHATFDMLWQDNSAATCWGGFWNSPRSPSGTMLMWNSDGSQIAYVSDEQEDSLTIVGNLRQPMTIQLSGYRLSVCSIRWTQTNMVLVRGEQQENIFNWFLIDSATGDVVWNFQESRGLSLETLANFHYIRAEISLDGRYIAISTRRLDVPSNNWISVIDLVGNESTTSGITIGHWVDIFLLYR